MRKRSQELEQRITEVKLLNRERYGTPDFASSWSLQSAKNYEADLIREANAADILKQPPNPRIIGYDRVTQRTDEASSTLDAAPTSHALACAAVTT
jgi:hypothetical protein